VEVRLGIVFVANRVENANVPEWNLPQVQNLHPFEAGHVNQLLLSGLSDAPTVLVVQEPRVNGQDHRYAIMVKVEKINPEPSADTRAVFRVRIRRVIERTDDGSAVLKEIALTLARIKGFEKLPPHLISQLQIPLFLLFRKRRAHKCVLGFTDAPRDIRLSRPLPPLQYRHRVSIRI
jgi:hypothetical protein